ncbi:alanine racemase [Azohydromonas caseinilytica]|uniref:alanine racemase n=1 Tax=Azohydromonas caseinilytica TaxID=2728836 RepID=UPI00197B3FDD|nr:alanine racemase [Azohydromonas caseinilytica]
MSHAFWQDTAGALLTIDLGAIRDNWRQLRARVGRARCAAVVKADAYGLGAVRVAPALADAGCRDFFVAHLDEALALKPLLPAAATLHVLHGPTPGAEAEFAAQGIVPVLNSPAQLAAWRALAQRLDRELPAFVQVDTGMARLGLAPAELRAVAADAQALVGVRVIGVMSHLACAEDQAHPANREQLERFRAARRLLPAAPASFANSSGVFLGEDYHFDLVRPGAALYGVAPVMGMPNPMRPVVKLQGKVIQVRGIEAGTPVGYGHGWRSGRPARIATVSVGYADGWLRSLSNRGCAWAGDVALPLVGKVSMDTVTLDASALPDGVLQPGALVELINERQGVDAVAAQAGTIGYEILTSLGQRYARRYLDEIEPAREKAAIKGEKWPDVAGSTAGAFRQRRRP